MREIKFRAWDKRQKALYRNWQRGSLVASVLSQKLAYTPTRNDQFKPDVKDMKNFVFMQYTGLKDKNGVEIYEGDILQNWAGENYPVVYSDEFAQFELQAPNNTLQDGDVNARLEVIGNIYENPDLLTPTNT